MITFWWRSTFRGTKTLDLSKIIGQHERILVSWWSALSEHLEKCLLIADEFTGCERMFNMDWKDRVRFNSSSHMQPQPSGTTAMHQRISWATPQEIWSPTLLHRPCFLDLPHGFFKHLILCCFIFLSKNDFNPSIYYPQKGRAWIAFVCSKLPSNLWPAGWHCDGENGPFSHSLSFY